MEKFLKLEPYKSTPRKGGVRGVLGKIDVSILHTLKL